MDRLIPLAILAYAVVVGGLIYTIYRTLEEIMADLTGINAALTDLSAQITQLSEQVAALSADTVTQAELDSIASDIAGAAAAVDAIIEPDAGETTEPA